MRTVLFLTVLSLLAAGCGAAEVGEVAEPEQAAAPPEDAAEALYEATGTVLEAPGGGPMLCLGPMLMSLPPQCGDIPIRGWSWDAVEGEQRHGGVRWGEFRVVGRYDGETFALVEAGPPGPAQAEPVEDLFVPPCPEPLCRGTLISREQYLVDILEWGYVDARMAPRGPMTATEIADWTEAIGKG